MTNLPCNADGIPHGGHEWDIGSGESFWCKGYSDEVGCTDDCPEGCEADHEGEE